MVRLSRLFVGVIFTFAYAFSASESQAQKPKSIIAKAVDELNGKLKAKDQKTVIAALKEAAELKNVGRPLLPQISRLLLGRDQRVAQQAAIAMEQIDSEFHATVMGLKPPAKWTNKTPSLHTIMQANDETFELYKTIIDWQLTMIGTLAPTPKGKTKPKTLLPSVNGKLQNGEGLTDDDLAVSQWIRILNRYPEKKSVLRNLVNSTLDVGDNKLRYEAFQWYVEDSSNSLTIDKQQLREYMIVYAKGLEDPSDSISLMIARDIAKFGAKAKGQLPQLERIAAIHASKEVRAAATEAIKKIEE